MDQLMSFVASNRAASYIFSSTVYLRGGRRLTRVVRILGTCISIAANCTHHR